MPTAGDITADRRAALAFDLKRLDAAFLGDPFPLYRALREHDPIHRMPDGSYFLSRYDDCAAVYRDPDTWSSDKTIDFRPNFADSLLYEHHTTSLVFNDPPYHSRVRRLLAPAFTPRALAALQPRIAALVDRLIDRALAKCARDGGIDLIGDFAAAIPVQLIGDMLGVPQQERGPLRGWSLAILGALEPVLSPEQFASGVAAVRDFKAYLHDLVARRAGEMSRDDDGEVLPSLRPGIEGAVGAAAGPLLDLVGIDRTGETREAFEDRARGAVGRHAGFHQRGVELMRLAAGNRDLPAAERELARVCGDVDIAGTADHAVGRDRDLLVGRAGDIQVAVEHPLQDGFLLTIEQRRLLRDQR